MRHRPLCVSVRRIRTLALLLAVGTCTDERSPFAPAKTWITPTGQVTSSPPALLVGAGDIAGCTQANDEETAKLLDGIPGTVFTAGDDVYDNGTVAEFANCYEPTWGRHKARTKPSAGNHEYNTANATGYFNYYGAAAGEPGKGYYSYDLGDWHVIVLNSSGGTAGTNISMAKGSAQEQWLKADLAANPKLCTLAYWHHPLYRSTGGTGTGGVTYSKARPVWDDLYAAGADLVVNGHWHIYERQAPQKPDRKADPVYGIREIIVGTGGIGHHGATNVSPNSEVRNDDTYGVLKLWLYPDSYAWKFVPVTGKTFSDSGSTACHAAPGSGPAVSASQSTVAAAPASITAGSETATISVTAKDGSGNPISGATVVLAATGSGNTLTQPSGPTNASGVATGTLSATVAEPKTVSATANGTGITQTASVTVNPGPVSAAQSTVAAAPASITAGSGTSTITATAKDANGNPVSGATVVLAATGTGNTLTQPAGPTNASGVATGTLSSTVAEAKIVSATINGTAVTQTATVTVTVTTGAVSATQSTVAAAPASITAGSETATITVTAKDAGGNPISGATVVLAATGSGNTLTQPSGPTDASGVATGTLSSTIAETKTVSATAAGVAIMQAASVTVTPASSTVVFAAAANISSCGKTRDEATATLLDAIPGSVVLVGNGAYPDGTATAYADCYDPSWGRHRARTYPTPGNQDYDTPGATGYFGYFGTAAGDPSKGYYSFDLGDWHIIVLNTGSSSTGSYAAGSAQELWLQADLAANTRRCTLAVLHRTRFFSSRTAGSFSSSYPKAIWNDLYAAGADLVLSGRLYHYERMAPQDPNGVRDDARGIRQFNVGTGGYTAIMPTYIAPNSEVVSVAYGVLRLTLAADSYTWEFVPIPGETFTDSGSGTCH